MTFQDQLPEVAQNPLPAALAGENHPATKLQTLRLGQLQCLAKAYGLDLRGGKTKNEIMPILAAAEATGVFRREPKDRYHLLLASRSPDSPLEGLDAEIANEELDAEHAKYRNREVMAKERRKKESIQWLRTRAKELGINTFQMSAGDISKAIMEKEVELENMEGPGGDDGRGPSDEGDLRDEGVSGQ